MKILALAHNCEVETYFDKDGKEHKFYNGPSPDEVALVEFASKMNYDCIETKEEMITSEDYKSCMGIINEVNMCYTKSQTDV